MEKYQKVILWTLGILLWPIYFVLAIGFVGIVIWFISEAIMWPVGY